MSISKEGGDALLFTVEWSEKERRTASLWGGVSVSNVLQSLLLLVVVFFFGMFVFGQLKPYYSKAVPLRALLSTFVLLPFVLSLRSLIRFRRRFIPTRGVFYSEGVEVEGRDGKLFLERKRIKVSLGENAACIHCGRRIIPIHLKGEVEEYLKGIRKDAADATQRLSQAILLSAVPSFIGAVAILYLIVLMIAKGQLSISWRSFRYSAEMFLPLYPAVFLPLAAHLTRYQLERGMGTSNLKIDLRASKKIYASLFAVLFGSATLFMVVSDPFYGLYSLRYSEWSGIDSIVDIDEPVPFSYVPEENITLTHSVRIMQDISIHDCHIHVNSSSPIVMVVERGARALFRNVTFTGHGVTVFSLVGRGALEFYNTIFRNLTTPVRGELVSGVIETYSTLKAVDVNITASRGTLIYAHFSALALQNLSAATSDYALLSVSSTVKISNSKILGALASYLESDVEVEDSWVYTYAYCHGRSIMKFKRLEEGSFISKYSSHGSRIDVKCENCTVSTWSLTYLTYMIYFIYPVVWLLSLIPAVSLMGITDDIEELFEKKKKV